MSSDLVAFLRARLDEDEQVAVAAGHKWSGIRVESYSEREPEHIARHDPARVLADVAAKRAVLAEHAAVQDHIDQMGGSATDRAGLVCASCGDQGRDDNAVLAPCPTLRFLALPYASHPEYRADEWGPDV